MLDAINVRLGDLDTHEKVQESLQRALDAEAAAVKTSRRATETLSDAQAKAVMIESGAHAKASEETARKLAGANELELKSQKLWDREMAVQGREEDAQREARRLSDLAV